MTIKRRGARNNLRDGDGIIKERNIRVVECSWGVFSEELKKHQARAVNQKLSSARISNERVQGTPKSN